MQLAEQQTTLVSRGNERSYIDLLPAVSETARQLLQLSDVRVHPNPEPAWYDPIGQKNPETSQLHPKGERVKSLPSFFSQLNQPVAESRMKQALKDNLQLLNRQIQSLSQDINLSAELKHPSQSPLLTTPPPPLPSVKSYYNPFTTPDFTLRQALGKAREWPEPQKGEEKISTLVPPPSYLMKQPSVPSTTGPGTTPPMGGGQETISAFPTFPSNTHLPPYTPSKPFSHYWPNSEHAGNYTEPPVCSTPLPTITFPLASGSHVWSQTIRPDIPLRQDTYSMPSTTTCTTTAPSTSAGSTLQWTTGSNGKSDSTFVPDKAHTLLPQLDEDEYPPITCPATTTLNTPTTPTLTYHTSASSMTSSTSHTESAGPTTSFLSEQTSVDMQEECPLEEDLDKADQWIIAGRKNRSSGSKDIDDWYIRRGRLNKGQKK